MINKSLFIEALFILVFCIVFSLIANLVSPKGIPVFNGQWDPLKGTMHAGGICAPKNQEMDFLSISFLLEKKMDRIVIVDARYKEDYVQGHIPGALSLPLGEFNRLIEGFMETVPFEKTIIAYCSGADCSDSHELAVLLKGAGYKNIQVYAGGMSDWVKNNKPMEKK